MRQKLIAIAQERRKEIADNGELHELWTKLGHGWDGCGWSSLYRNEATGTVVGLPYHCDKIACPYCEVRRVGKVRDRYRLRHDEALAERRLYLVVLTIPNVPPGELRAALDRLRKAIGKMRRRAWWADAVVGGIWRLEVTVNLETRTWHPHANILFETSRPIRMAEWQPQLQQEWRSVLGESAEQWAWLMEGWAGSLPETVKRQVSEASETAGRDTGTSIDYTVKPDPHWIDPSDPVWVVEYVEGLVKSRSVSSFGKWRGLPKPKQEHIEELVSAPYAPGDDFFVERFLPALDPLRDTPAVWKFHGYGPRWALRPHRPPGDRRQEWLVWDPADGTKDPASAVDDPLPGYQARLAWGHAA